jgi:hypothetical protein
VRTRVCTGWCWIARTLLWRAPSRSTGRSTCTGVTWRKQPYSGINWSYYLYWTIP